MPKDQIQHKRVNIYRDLPKLGKFTKLVKDNPKASKAIAITLGITAFLLLLSGFGSLVVGGILTISFITWSISATASIITSATCFSLSLLMLGGSSYAITRARGKKEEVRNRRHILSLPNSQLGKKSNGFILGKVSFVQNHKKDLKNKDGGYDTIKQNSTSIV